MKNSNNLEQRINPFLKKLSQKIIPKFIFRFLDPFVFTIDKEINNLVKEYDSDRLTILDGGCGENRYKKLFKSAKFIGLDRGIGDKTWDYSKIDVSGNLENLPFKNNSFDLIISIVTLEHVENPEKVLKEFYRTLKKGGKIFLIVPFMWEYHQIPYDYFRFTKSGIGRLLKRAKFINIVITPIGGFFWLFSRRLFNLLTFFQKNILWILFFTAFPFVFLASSFFYILDKFDTHKNFTLGYKINAKK